jgi:hypothetical protein
LMPISNQCGVRRDTRGSWRARLLNG